MYAVVLEFWGRALKMGPWIVAGYPEGSWSRVLPLLQRISFVDASDAFGRWLDSIARNSGAEGDAHFFPPADLPPPWLTDGMALAYADARNFGLLDELARQSPDARFLLLFSQPGASVVKWIQSGKQPDRALDEWRAANERVLTFWRRNRHRAVILDCEAVLANPIAFFSYVQISNSVNVPERQEPTDAEDSPYQRSLESLLTAAITCRDTAIGALHAELVAAAIPLGDGVGAAVQNLSAVFEHYVRIKGGLQRAESLSRRCLQVESDLGSLAERSNVLERERQISIEDNQLLGLQVQQLQAELEYYLVAYQQGERERGAMATELHVTHRKLEAVQASAIWRLTAPLRGLGRVVMRMTALPNRRVARAAKVLNDSGLFNKEWYLAVFDDVRAAGVDPIVHYIEHGAGEGRNPSPAFDTRFYLSRYPDVASSGMNPFVHYVKYGRHEGRLPAP